MYHFSEIKPEMDNPGQMMVIWGRINLIGRVLAEMHHFLFFTIEVTLLYIFYPQSKHSKFKAQRRGGREGQDMHGDGRQDKGWEVCTYPAKINRQELA